MSILLESLEKEADLHGFGHVLIRKHLLDLLETRLRLTHIWKEQATSLEGASIESPMFIIGMPRSGSTFLHELLAEDPRHRVPRFWEVMFPIPGTGRAEATNRMRKAAACLWWFRRLVPEADSVYPMRAMTPHECVSIHSYTFLSEEFLSTCEIPSYADYLHSADLTPVYGWERKFLQYLQLNTPARRWVLKSPDHVHGLEAMWTVFPDAWIIQTHRNPVEVIRSSANLTRALHGLYGRHPALEVIWEREAKMVAQASENFMRFRDTHPELAPRFIDVKYSELVGGPLAMVRRIYERLGTMLPESTAERMESLACQRARYRRPRTGRLLTDLHLEPLMELGWFQRYCSRFELTLHPEDLRG